MKNLSFFVSAFALCTSTSYAAINCSTLPTCESLGYTDKVAECPKVYSWNATSKKLVATTTPKAVICPFDTAKGRCLHDAKVGDLKYSLHTVNHEGWILCDGQSLDTTTYSALYNVIGSNYGMDGTKFRVPDYRGFFLRASGTASVNNSLSSFGGSANSSLTAPQKEQLPNITGTFATDDNGYTGNVGHWFNIGSTTKLTDFTKCTSWNPCQNRYVSGAFSFYNRAKDSDGYTNPKGPDGNGSGGFAQFQAKHSNPIYTDSGHVIPANYAANIFIYAGR